MAHIDIKLRILQKKELRNIEICQILSIFQRNPQATNHSHLLQSYKVQKRPSTYYTKIHTTVFPKFWRKMVKSNCSLKSLTSQVYFPPNWPLRSCNYVPQLSKKPAATYFSFFFLLTLHLELDPKLIFQEVSQRIFPVFVFCIMQFYFYAF